MINHTPQQRALKDLQRFRKRSDVEIDYKAELAEAREEKYVDIAWSKGKPDLEESKKG